MNKENEKFNEILENTMGGEEMYKLGLEEYQKQFNTWAASWDCKEAETKGHDGPMIGDEIEVGTLWEDKSQKDFKSYL